MLLRNTWCGNGTVVLKFFLHVSKKEQKKRLLARLDDPTKHCKFSAADLEERGAVGATTARRTRTP